MTSGRLLLLKLGLQVHLMPILRTNQLTHFISTIVSFHDLNKRILNKGGLRPFNFSNHGIQDINVTHTF